MSKETILTFFGATCSDAAVKNAIEMAENKDAHLSIVLIAASPAIYTYGYGMPYAGYAGVDQWTRELKEQNDALDLRVGQIEKLVQSEGISADVLIEYCEFAVMPTSIMRHANVADSVVLVDGHGIAGDVEDAIISSVIFESPIGLMKGANSHVAAVKSPHVFIAWDSTKHAAVAVHNAIPLLVKSDQVTIAVFDPVKREGADGEEPGADLASWLARHGCSVNVEQYPSGGEEIATCIIKRAVEKGADLIVMGGYGHMKLKQQIFGGTTKSMLEQHKIPVLIGHK